MTDNVEEVYIVYRTVLPPFDENLPEGVENDIDIENQIAAIDLAVEPVTKDYQWDQYLYL
jgi:hypothetical protein